MRVYEQKKSPQHGPTEGPNSDWISDKDCVESYAIPPAFCVSESPSLSAALSEVEAIDN
jgi:hypothetical protein